MQKLEIRAITPGDCKRISMEISKRLNKNVSETTIKRLFGFAETKHQFSRFTLTTLLEYVDQNEMFDLVRPELANMTETDSSRANLHNTSIKITAGTLKGIRNRSGLPYEMTISRKFAEQDFFEFFKSTCRFTCFIAQPGYGKTTLLSHLVEGSFFGDYPIYTNSSVLFLNVAGLINEDKNFYIEEAIKEQLKIPSKESVVEYIHRYYQQDDEKFILVLDGFCEVFLKRERRNQLFDNILNFICELENSNAIKVVMSMRSTTWIRFHERMRHSAYLRSVWYKGNYFNANDISNVPPLTMIEIDQIISKMTMINVDEINPKLKAQLKFPFHIQLYYQLNEEDPHFNYYSNLSIYELISKFIQEKIYRSNYFTEKILFLKKIIQLTNYGKSGISVPKGKLIGELSVFKNAYMELLADGILMEERISEDSHPREFVRFIHPHIFEYFLFIEILEKFNLSVDEKIFKYIKEEYDSNQICFILLQWAIRFVVKTGNLSTLKCLFKLGLNNYEKNYLILFIAENLKHRINYQPGTFGLIKQYQVHEDIIKELIVFDFIDSCYKEAISVLIEIAESEEHIFLYHSILAIPDILSMDRQKILTRLTYLSRYKEQGEHWVINPYKATNLIYNKILNIPIDPEEVAFFRPGTNTPNVSAKDFDTQLATGYILTFAFNLYFGEQKNVITLVKDIQHISPTIFFQRSPLSIHLLNLLGIAQARVHPGPKVDQIERIISKVLESKCRFAFTKYSESLFMLLHAMQCHNRGQYTEALSTAEECLEIFKRNNQNLNCLFTYNLIITIYSDLQDTDNINEYKYERLCYLEERKLPKHLFGLPRVLH